MKTELFVKEKKEQHGLLIAEIDCNSHVMSVQLQSPFFSMNLKSSSPAITAMAIMTQ